MPMTMPEIENALKNLRLSGILETLEARSLQVTQGEVAFLDAFGMLLQDEMDRRKSRFLERRFKLSGLKERKTLNDFDWTFNPKLPKKQCLELLSLGFLNKHEDVLIIGAPGTGKSHTAQAISHAATQAGYRVLYREAHRLFEDLFQAQQFGTRKRTLTPLVEVDLLVIDDLFLRKKMPADAADDFQEIVLDRYAAKRSTLITSNRIVEDWGKCLGDNAVAAAILDRLLHRGHLLKFEGKSYRLKEAASRLAKEKKLS